MRRAAALLAVLILAGCGGREPAEPDPAADRKAIQQRVVAYVGAMLTGNGTRACDQFTPRYRRDTEQRARDGGLGTCAEAIALYGEAVSGMLPAGFARQAADPGKVHVRLKGNAAEAAMKVPGKDLSLTRTTLRRVGERWLIDNLGVRPRG